MGHDADTDRPAPQPTEPAGSGRRRRRAVVNLRDVRPAWEIPQWARQSITSSFPPEWDTVFVDATVDGRGDGSGTSAEALAAAPGTEVYFGFGAPREIFLAAVGVDEPQLRWIHTCTAGVASLLYPELVESDVVLTNSAGALAPPMAETVFAMILHFARGLDHAVRAQASASWDTGPFSGRVGGVTEIGDATLGILGLGGIGMEVARRGLALGMRVLATRRSGRPAPAGIDVRTGPDALSSLLAESDYIVIALPSTPATRGLIGPAEFAAIRDGAVLVNVARGDVIDEGALIEALREGRLRGAGLDVFRTEPLPRESPLWHMPNVLVTPHVSATSPRFWDREIELIRDNITRYLAGRALRNVVDKKLGY